MPLDILAQIEKWRTQLLDISNRNRLVNFKRGGRSGGISLVHPDPNDLWHYLVAKGKKLILPWQRDLVDLPEEPTDDDESDQEEGRERTKVDAQRVLDQCRTSPRLTDDHILTDFSDKQLGTRLTRLAYNAREALTEQGVTILYVAFGFLRWFETPNSEGAIASPLMLVPVRLERASVEAPWQLQVEDDEILPNHTLSQRLIRDFKLNLPLVDDESIDPEDPSWRTNYLAEVQRCVRDFPRWEVLDDAALGVFNFQKLAMWEDLGRNQERIKSHDLCRAIAGDRSVSLRGGADAPAAEHLDDKTRPDETYHILDADSSQHAALVAATRGANLVLDGPPGTGKSQTIANTIAEFLAAGKTVLFVSEKTAALEVVKRRLDERRLGDFCLELHSHKANKKAVINELGRCLDLTAESYRDPSDDLRRLLETRAHLNAYVRELHVTRSPLGRSAYSVHGEIARLQRLKSLSRCDVPDVLNLDAAYLQQITDLLASLPDCRSVIEDGSRHPWRGCEAIVYSLTLRDDIQHHFGRLVKSIAGLQGAAAALHEVGLAPAMPTQGTTLGAIDDARAILACPRVPVAWFAHDIGAYASAVIKIDDLTRQARNARNNLAGCDVEKVWRLDTGDLGALRAAQQSGPGLLPTEQEGARAYHQRLIGAGPRLRELQRLAKGLDVVEQQARAVLGVQLPQRPIGTMRQFAEMLEHVAQAPVIKPSYWDVGRRQELQSALTRYRAESSAAQELRKALLGKFSPQAFSIESAAVIARASRYRSFLSRLLPTWWSLKRSVSEWYVQAQTQSTLNVDIQSLATYHRQVSFCREVHALYADDLDRRGDGQPNVDGAMEALDSVDRLTGHGKIDPRLQQLLSTDGKLEKPALADAAQALRQSHSAFMEAWDAAREQCGLAARQNGSEGISATAAELVESLTTMADAVERQTTAVARICELLTATHDPNASSLPGILNALIALTTSRHQTADLVPALGLADVRAAEDLDWSTDRLLADKLVQFLNAWKRPLSQEVIRALTEQEIRDRVAESVQLREDSRKSFEESWQFLAKLFKVTDDVSSGISLNAAPLDDLKTWLAARIEDAPRLQEWTKYKEVYSELNRAKVSSILDEVHTGQVKLDEAAAAFRSRFLRLWLDAFYEQVPALRQFATDNQERIQNRFRDLDRRSVASAPARVRNLLLTRPDRPGSDAEDAPDSSELGTLLREVHKKRRHLPLRKLFAAIPSLLPRLKPCLMMSPLAVSTYLQSPDSEFDLVIFDEASQVRPHDAVCAIYRGRQLVVAGDQKQLPPTSFFDRALDENMASDDADEEAVGLHDYESILDVCCTLGMMRRRLRWHYRSRRESLIAFANHHVYGNELVTFPSVHDLRGNPAVGFTYVADGCWKAGSSGGFNAVEAERTAQMVLQHFRDHPDETLGVIAFSQRQQLRIIDELEKLRRIHTDLEEHFQEGCEEPFFVKNLENVQGDQRDVILLGIGYGPDENRRLAMNFGPLNRQGGERRLNVAVTRACLRMNVVSSIRAQDIDLNRTKAVGARLLRAYLDYAERGTEALLAGVSEDGDREFESPFEREVHDELTRRGLTVHWQIGCSGFRIDLAIVHPERPGLYLLGIECDGATYHSSATARDRDRLRQEVLESLGWRICRVWSTDWVRDRESQVKRVLAALEKAKSEPVPPLRLRRPMPSPDVVPPNQSDAEPRIARSEPPTSTYASIEDVPIEEIDRELLRRLRAYGATGDADLAQAVARQLGFKRTGKRIQSRIEERINVLIQDGNLSRTADGRLAIATTQRATTP